MAIDFKGAVNRIKKAYKEAEQKTGKKAVSTKPVQSKPMPAEKDFYTPNRVKKPEQPAEPTTGLLGKWVKAAEDFVRNDFDAMFTPEKLLEHPAVESLNKTFIGGQKATPRDMVQQMDLVRKMQAGFNYDPDAWMGEGVTDDDKYAANSILNENFTTSMMDEFFKDASEDDVQYLLDELEKNSANSRGDYQQRMLNDLEYAKKIAGGKYTRFAQQDVNALNKQISQNNLKINEAKQNEDALIGSEYAAEADYAMELIDYGADPAATVSGFDTLRKAINYDELEKKYQNSPEALNNAVTERMRQYVSGTYRGTSDLVELEVENERLKKQRDALIQNRDNINQRKQDQGMEDAAWVDDDFRKYIAANPNYKYSQETSSYIDGFGNEQVTTTESKPSLMQIIAEPDLVEREYRQHSESVNDAKTQQDIDYARLMTAKERRLALAIAQNFGEDSAAAYFERLKEDELYARDMEEVVTNAEQFADEHGVLGTAASFATRFIGNIASGGAAISGATDPNDPRYQFSNITETTRDTVGGNIAEATQWANIGGVNPFQYLYGVGTSVGDNLFTRALTGFASAPAELMMGLGAFGDAYKESYERTGDVGTARLVGGIAGALESALEHISWDKLGAVDDLSDGAAKYIGTQALTEAGEEGLTTVGNILAQLGIERSESEIIQKYKDYTRNGYSSGEAIKKIAVETVRDIGLDALAGGISGAALSGGNAIRMGAQQSAETKATGQGIIDTGNAAELIRRGLESADKGIRKLAERIASKIGDDGLLNRDAETQAELAVIAEELGAAQRTANEAQGKLDEAVADVESAPADMSTAFKSSLEADVQDAQDEVDAANQQVEEIKGKQAETEAKANADMQAIQAALSKGGKAIGNLYTKLMKAIDVEIEGKSRTDIVNGIKKRLGELGEKNISDEIAGAIADSVTGKKLQKKQQDILEAATYSKQVIRELAASMVSTRAGGNLKEKSISEETRNAMAERARLMTAPTAKLSEKTEAAAAPEVQADMTISASGETSITGDDGTEMPVNVTEFTEQDGEIMAVVEHDGEQQTVSMDSLMAGDDIQATLYTRAARLGNAAAATAMVQNYDTAQDVDEYSYAFQTAFNYGTAGVSANAIKGSASIAVLSSDQFNAAYEAGAGQPMQATAPARSGGGFTFADGLEDRLDGLVGNQKDAVNALRKIASICKVVNIEVFESTADESGSYAAYENGSYDPTTNTLRIDINAGKNNVGDVASYALLRTASHELTHYIRAWNTDGYKALQDFVIGQLTAKSANTFDGLVAEQQLADPRLSYAAAVEEVVANACEMMLRDSTAVQRLAQENRGLFTKVRDWIRNFTASVKRAFQGVSASSEEAKLIKDMEGLQKIWDDALVQAMQKAKAEATPGQAMPLSENVRKAVQNDQPVTAEVELKNSIRNDALYMNAALDMNRKNGYVSAAILQQAAKDRAKIRAIFMDPANRDLLKLPPDIEGDTFVSDASYGGTEENTTVCIRSMAAQALMDLISQNLGRPLTVQDTLLISQEIAGLTDRPECYYCYVATDRRAYRDFLGQYLQQRDAVIKKYRSGANRDELYQEFLGGRKPTANMKARFNMWLNAVDKGTALIDGNDLASLENLFGEIDALRSEILAAAAESSGVDAGKLNIVNGSVRYAKGGKQITATTLNNMLKNNPGMAASINRYMQLTDATAYAQSASWAKKMKGYAAYNNHILKWSQKRIDDLNKHYGLRMYSFSDFSPAFILENMQMVTDAAVRGLNMLGYTKEMSFAEIFAPSGMNINISTFAYEQGGDVKEDYKQGASWERAKALREKHPNVGIVMVATSDRILEWALQQDWVDVVIPYHLVRTGTDVAEYFGYKNYTGVSADGKGLSFAEKNKGKSKKERVTSVSPVEHRNDLISYVDALERYGLTPRFAQWLNGLDDYRAGNISPKQFREMNPNYMKLVNETRRSYADTAPVQPKFDMSAATEAINQMVREGGYYQPVGGTMEEEFRIAGEIADKVRDSSVKYSRRASTDDADVKHALRTKNLSDREILADAFESVAQNDNERSFLQKYKAQIEELNQKQTQLDQVRSDIRSIMFAPGKRDAATTAQLNKLKNTANILADQINRADKRLLGFESAKPLQNVLARERRKIEAQSAEKRQESIAKLRDRREATEIRHKIKAVLDDFNRRLKSPTEKKYIPAGMVNAVIAAEELINTDFWEGKNLTTDRSIQAAANAKTRIAAMRAIYDRYKNDAQFSYAYDQVISDMLKHLEDVVGDKTIYQLGKAELTDVYDVLKALKKQVTEAVKLKAGEYAATIFDAGQQMIEETLEAAPLSKVEAVNDLLNWQLTPDKFFARLAGYKKNSVWSKVAETFAKGTEKMYEIQRDHYYHFKEFTESKEFDALSDRKKLVDIGLVDSEGKPVLITRGMMLSVYMHLSSEDNARGFMYGGFSVPSLAKYYTGNMGDAYGRGSINSRGTAAELAEIAEQLRNPDLTDEQREKLNQQYEDAVAKGEAQLDAMRADIEQKMTDWEKNLIKAVHAWNDGKSQQYINDVTMDLYGIKKANVKNYYPIHRDTAFIKTDFESISKNMNLENWGSLKDRVKSQAPILLTDIAFEMDNGLNQMSRYVGYVRAQRDFNKLYNVRIPGMRGSVKKVVSTKFGSGAKKLGVTGEQYIENYINDITGSRHSSGSLVGGIRRNLVRSTMTLNLRVGFSQLSAIPKAAAEVGWDNMAKGFFNGGMKAMVSKKAREELAQQNVWFWQRYRGEGGQREFADAKSGSNVIDRVYNKVADSKVVRWLFNWCQNFDVMSTVTMWSMAKEWAKKNTSYAEGSAEFNEAANRKYTDIIRNTQAMSTTSERSDLARTTAEGYSLLTMFKSEAFANFNLLYDGVAKWRKYSADLKAGKNGVTKQDLNQAKRQVAGAATSVVIGASLGNAVLKLAINALMHAMNGYRDDEDEVTLQSTLTAIGNEVASDMAGMMVFGGEVYELISAAVMGEKYYAPSDMALAEIAQALETVVKVAQDEDRTAGDVYNAGKKLAFNITGMLGIPAENAKRYWDGAAAWADEWKNDTPWYMFEGGYGRSSSTNYNRLTKAALAGDDAKWDMVVAELEAEGKDIKDARSGFRSNLQEMYISGEVDLEKTLSLLKKYGDQDDEEANEQVKKWDYNIETGMKHGNMKEDFIEGKFDRETAIEYLKEYDLKEEEKAIETVAKWEYERDTKRSYSDIRDDYLEGDVSEADLRKYLASVEGLNEKEVDERVDKYEYYEYTGKSTTQPKYWKLAYTYQTGGDYKAYADQLFDEIMSETGSNGKKKSWKQARSSIASSLAGYYKKDYLAVKGTPAGDKMLEEILDVYEVIGYPRSYERDYIEKKWKPDEDE